MISRIIVAADIHLSADPAFQGAQLRPSLAERFVAGCQALNPDAIVIVGDLVNSGCEAEYQIARQILQPIQSKCFVAIGNHELQAGSIADWERGTGHRPTRALEIAPLPGTLINSGIENLPSNQWGGRADDQSILTLSRQLRLHHDLPHMLFTHHPLIGTVRKSEEMMMGLDNTLEVFDQLKHHPHEVVVFSGHTHTQSFVQTGNIYCIGLPPICFWPHAFMLVECSSRQMSAQTIRLIEDPAESPDPAAADPASRARLEASPSEQNFSITLR